MPFALALPGLLPPSYNRGMSEGHKNRLLFFSVLFQAFRAAYITAVLWSSSMLFIVLVVNRPGKGRYPGTIFSRDVFPTVSSLVFWLFFVGATSVALSKQAADSTAIRWCTYISFAATIFAGFLFVTTMF